MWFSPWWFPWRGENFIILTAFLLNSRIWLSCQRRKFYLNIYKKSASYPLAKVCGLNRTCSLSGMATSFCTALPAPLAWPTWPEATCTGLMTRAPSCPGALWCSPPAACSLPSTGTCLLGSSAAPVGGRGAEGPEREGGSPWPGLWLLCLLVLWLPHSFLTHTSCRLCHTWSRKDWSRRIKIPVKKD